MLGILREFTKLSPCKKIFIATALFFAAENFDTVSAAVKLGDRGEEVREVQVCLIAQELLSGEADGICGEATVAAIKSFQEAVGLPVDGICGESTFRLLRAAAYGEIDITDFMVAANSAPTVNNFTEEISSGYAEIGDVIKRGMTGPGVVEVQKILIELGYLEGTADGICGSATVNAIKNFQESIGMPADGICGIMTYAALENFQYTEDNAEWEESIAEFPQFSRTIRVEATAYSSQEAGINLHTAIGTPLRYGVIAVDPNVIPLGTRVYIPGYGEAVAEDTGGDIIGYRIDIAFETYAEALNFGRQSLEIYIIDD